MTDKLLDRAPTFLVVVPYQPVQPDLIDALGAHPSQPDTEEGLKAVKQHLGLTEGAQSVYRCERDGSWWRVIEPAQVYPKMYGFLSERARAHGSSLYKTPDGREVLVTGVDSDPEGTAYRWADKVSVGEVIPAEMGGYIREVDLHKRGRGMVPSRLALPLAVGALGCFDSLPARYRRGPHTPVVGAARGATCTCSVPTKTSRRGLCTSCGKQARS